MNRAACIAACLASGLFMSGACLADEGGKIRVRVYGLAAPGSNNPIDAAERNVILAFQKKHPEIQLESATGLRVEGVGAEVGPLLMIAGGIAPDVLQINFRKIDSYVRQGLLFPLDEFIEREQRENPKAFDERLIPQILPVVRRPSPEGHTHFYAMPVDLIFVGLYFNKNLFREADLPLRAPRTWRELEEFGRKIQALNSRNIGLALAKGQQASWYLMNFLWSCGGDAVREVEPNTWRAAFNTPAAVEAFEFYYKLVEGDRIAVRLDAQALKDPRMEERIGMVFGYIGETVTRDPNKWGFGPVPEGPRGQSCSEVNAHMYGIYAGVKDPRVREAAWKFISFTGSEEARRIRVETLIRLGDAASVNPADLERFGFLDYLRVTQPGLAADFRRVMENARPEPYGKNCDLVYVEMTYPLDQMLLSSSLAREWRSGNRDAARREIQAILDRAVAATDQRMIGVVSEDSLRGRRLVAAVVVAAMAMAFLLVGWRILKTFEAVGRASTRTRGRRAVVAWIILLPALALIVMWHYLPLLRGLVIATLDYQLMRKSLFVGLDNFATVLFEPHFWSSLAATFHYAAWMLTLGFFAPIVLAFLLHLAPRGTVIYRTVYYIPSLLTGAAVFVLWKEFFDQNGVMNELLRYCGLEARRAWTDNPSLAMLTCVLPTVWAGAGPGCLIYLAALKTIPHEQFEAAEIDGAGFWGKTWNIIVPGLKPLIVINFIGAAVHAFQQSQNILLMTAGGPNGMTEVTSLLIFYEAFLRLKFGTSTAMAWMIGSLLVGFSVIQLRRLSQMEFKTAKA